MKVRVDTHRTWCKAGRDLARVDPEAFRRLLIAAQTIVDVYAAEDPEPVAMLGMAMMGRDRGGGGRPS